MENENFIEKMAASLQTKASVKNVFGEPVIANGKTIIPVAQIAFGFGGGFGHGSRGNKLDKLSQQDGEGAGGGGGMYARPKGVYEITDQGTRFIPTARLKPLLFAALAGFVIRGWLRRR